MLIELANVVDRSQLGLQAFDKGLLTKEETKDAIGIDFSTGDFDGVWNSTDAADRITVLY